METTGGLTVIWIDLSILRAAIHPRYIRIVDANFYVPLGDQHDPLRCVQGVVRFCAVVSRCESFPGLTGRAS